MMVVVVVVTTMARFLPGILIRVFKGAGGQEELERTLLDQPGDFSIG